MRAAALLAVLLALLQEKNDLKPGLLGEYYSFDHEIQDFPTLASDKKPAVRKIDAELNFDATDGKFAGTELEDRFFVRWSGVVRVPADARYTFYTESDDGSRVFIDGKPVVDNGGLHGMEEKGGEVDLKAGDHEIRVDFFENAGESGCKLSWEAKGQEKKIIPASALFHQKDKDLDKE
jgi:hypothetical protein